MLRKIVLTAGAVVLVGGMSMTSAGAGGNYGGCSATVSDTTPAPGQTITVTGSGAVDGGAVSATLDDAEIGTGTADASGSFTFDATIPSTANGTETLAVSCGVNRGTFPLTLTIEPGGAGLPATGSDAGTAAAVGFGALALGAAAVGASRWRARASA